MAMNTGGDDNMMSEINVTPLVDVMLVLLTVFIVTAPLLMNSVPVNLPKASSDLTLTQPESINISITADGTMYFSDDPVSPEQLDVALNEAAQNVDTSVEIFADEKAEYGTVAKVMAAIQRAGISKFTFVMQPESDS
ncbi:MAG: biopolymer transporter ExbD [Pseudomonadota bacterium]|jgi:biopolymer transport protein ExbD|uniref:Biopolymer transport protein ExbD n=2 Tax=Methylophaga TaxID=40222 RepID=A0ABQ5TV36_9GAMM|nr:MULTISPECIES: biopolymer transporter ExbD [Methylophaga]MEC9411681.1 biopolymer transporter ExbD [Pseudomonadota bacterium]GLP99048.1 biopolymer transport protein ExbD [Methylophaga thalassica]HIM40219.1 biopolymer transporter ExbD [Methylophaga aminisulfidivorans]